MICPFFLGWAVSAYFVPEEPRLAHIFIGATLCATDHTEDEAAPTIRRTGDRLYLRLRREDYVDADVQAWAERLVPFLESGLDAYAFFRHDADGHAAELAEALAAGVEARRRG